MIAVEGAAPFAAWALSVYGLTMLVTQSIVMRPLRRRIGALSRLVRLSARPILGRRGQRGRTKIEVLLHCPMCFGFWAALLLALFHVRLLPGGFLSVLLSASAGSAVSWILHLTTVRLGALEM